MVFTTYENKNNPHITIHKEGCSQIKKNGGTGIGEYKHHESLVHAREYAKKTGMKIIECSYCKPGTL
ncbi:MAG: hypothetical protein KKI09_02920 [Spirochaetes bacterium]|nr:hypothetical protein [Spirochaetota bacterium]MBU0954357.1 hypothetical protein [Spirochaetota bacterium]